MSLLCNDSELLEIDTGVILEEGASDHLILSLAHDDLPTNRAVMEAEKRIRREIANSNERRRMQSINAGFQSLRTLLPRHEGEKLSKAAILQQTAEYIYSLEQEKTRLLSQNCQLKRQLNQQDGNEVPIKKRKAESVVTLPDNTEDCMRTDLPEPVALLSVSSVPSTKHLTNELSELRLNLDRERRLRMLLEDQIRNCETQMYSEDIRDLSQQMTLQYDECTEAESVVDNIAEVATTEVDHREPLQIVAIESLPPVAEHRTVGESESRSPSPRLPPLLEAAIKAEPKVEVEVLPDARSPSSPSRLYLASTSRQNLETIVEAIRHLEGDHLFGEEPGQQDLPLALTNKPDAQQRLLQMEVEPFLQFNSVQRRVQARPGVIVVKHS